MNPIADDSVNAGHLRNRRVVNDCNLLTRFIFLKKPTSCFINQRLTTYHITNYK